MVATSLVDKGTSVHINEWLQAIPPLAIYLVVGGVIGFESLGIPLPGEIVLISASLLAAQGVADPLWIGICASAGAILGDTIGYSIGRKYGPRLFVWLGGKFPKHFGPDHLAQAEKAFDKWGMWAVFFGRFIALLRIFAVRNFQYGIFSVPARGPAKMRSRAMNRPKNTAHMPHLSNAFSACAR